jgi:threonine dehydratase
MSPLPTIADIEADRDRLLGRARRTPLLAATPLDAETGGRILFKLETLQHTGSF